MLFVIFVTCPHARALDDAEAATSEATEAATATTVMPSLILKRAGPRWPRSQTVLISILARQKAQRPAMSRRST